MEAAELDDGGVSRNRCERLCRSLTDLVEWPQQCFKLLPEEGVAVLKKTVQRGVLLSSHYSGIASVETMLEYLNSTAKGMTHDGASWNGFVCYSACDIDASCRIALSVHGGPQHIFGDLLGMWDPLTQSRLQSEAQKMQAQDGVDSRPPEELARAWVAALEAIVSEGHLVERCWCYKHRRYCDLHCVRPSAEWLSMNAAGSTCNDFSAMGSRKRERGPSMAAFICWRAERMRRFLAGEEEPKKSVRRESIEQREYNNEAKVPCFLEVMSGFLLEKVLGTLTEAPLVSCCQSSACPL